MPQWIAEARQLFATSLARIQFDAWSIASGEDAVHVGADGYVDKTPKHLKAGDLCGHFKFRSSGYRNIDFLAFVLTVVLVPILSWILSRRVQSAKMESSISEQGDGHLPQSIGNTKSSHEPDLKQRNYGTMRATGHRGSGLLPDQNAMETPLAGPSKIPETVSSGAKGKGIESFNGEGREQKGDSESDHSDFDTLSEAAKDAKSDGRLTAGFQEQEEIDNGIEENYNRMEEDENIVLFWLIGKGWSSLCSRAAELKLIYHRPS